MKKYDGYYVYIKDEDIQKELDILLKTITALEKEEDKKSFRARIMLHNIDKHEYHLNRLIGVKLFLAKQVVLDKSTESGII